MGVAVSSSHVVSAAPSSSGEGLLTLLPCSSVGSLPRETVLHELLHHEAFSWAAILHELLQHGCFPQSADLREQTAPARIPHGVTSPDRKPAPAWALRGVTASFGCIPLLWHGVLPGLQVEICCTMDLHGLQGHSLPRHGLHHRLHGNLCSGTWSTSSPSLFFTDLGVCSVVSLTYSHSSLRLQGFFSPSLICYHRALPLSALASSRSI